MDKVDLGPYLLELTWWGGHLGDMTNKFRDGRRVKDFTGKQAAENGEEHKHIYNKV